MVSYGRWFLTRGISSNSPSSRVLIVVTVTMNYAFLYGHLSVRYLGVKKEMKRLQSSIASFHVSLIVFR